MRLVTSALACLIAVGAIGCERFQWPCAERRHATGLLLVCEHAVVDMSEELKGTASFAWDLAEANPDVLGYPWPDPSTGELELRIVDRRGQDIAREWIAGRALRSGLKPPLEIRPPMAPVRFRTVDRSFRQLEDIKHGSIPATGMPDGDAIYMTAPDQQRNAVLIVVDRHSDDLFRALSSRYGTAAIVIRIDPNRPRFSY